MSEKRAGIWDAFKSGYQAEGGRGIAGALGAHLPQAIAAGAVAGAGAGLYKGFEALRSRLTKSRDFKAMLQATPDLREYDAGQTQMVYNSLRSLAPSLARDPLIAGSFVHGMLTHPGATGPMIPPQTAKLLVDTQKNMEARSIMQQMAESAAKAGPIQRIDVKKPEQKPTGYTETSTEKDPQGNIKSRRSTKRTFKY